MYKRGGVRMQATRMTPRKHVACMTPCKHGMQHANHNRAQHATHIAFRKRGMHHAWHVANHVSMACNTHSTREARHGILYMWIIKQGMHHAHKMTEGYTLTARRVHTHMSKQKGKPAVMQVATLIAR